MDIFWNALDSFQQTLTVIALPASLALVILFVGIIFGKASDKAFVVCPKGASFNERLKCLLTLKGILGFLSIGAWTGVLAVNIGSTHFVAIIIGLLFGMLANYFMFLAFRVRDKDNTSRRLSSMVGSLGTVSEDVPDSRLSLGKVELKVGDETVAYDAMSDNVETLAAGEEVEVVGVEGSVFLVRPTRRFK